jgi:NAD+ diphosphatase
MSFQTDLTFGGSQLDRAAELRGDAQGLAALRADPQARSLVLWRGKPLVDQDAALVCLRLDHPVLEGATGQIFLGRDGAGIFASDISDWDPGAQDASQVGAFVDTTEQRHPDLPQAYVFAELRRIMTRLTPRDAELAATARALFSWHDSHRFCAKCGAPSKMVKAGWERHCATCNSPHFPRTDPVVIMLITRGNKTLIGRSPGWPEGMYSCLAGFVEPGETIEAAVRREVWEEAGVPVGKVRYIASQPWAFPSSLMLGFQGEALGGDITLDPEEIEDARWVSREELAEAFAGTHPTLLPARKGAIAHYLLRNWLADQLD